MKKNQLLLKTLMELCYSSFKEYEFLEGTIKRYKDKLRELILFMNERDLPSYNESIGEAFIQYVVSKKTLADYTLKTFKRTIYFLHYLHEEKYIDRDLSVVFPIIKPHRREKIPSFYTPEEINKIESVVERTSAIGKRNYAMLLLASRLGLRASDIRTLQFSNIDWDKNMIRLEQYKTKRDIDLPLLLDVGEARCSRYLIPVIN